MLAGGRKVNAGGSRAMVGGIIINVLLVVEMFIVGGSRDFAGGNPRARQCTGITYYRRRCILFIRSGLVSRPPASSLYCFSNMFHQMSSLPTQCSMQAHKTTEQTVYPLQTHCKTGP